VHDGSIRHPERLVDAGPQPFRAQRRIHPTTPGRDYQRLAQRRDDLTEVPLGARRENVRYAMPSGLGWFSNQGARTFQKTRTPRRAACPRR
jgi:hypothetical protein